MQFVNLLYLLKYRPYYKIRPDWPLSRNTHMLEIIDNNYYVPIYKLYDLSTMPKNHPKYLEALVHRYY